MNQNDDEFLSQLEQEVGDIVARISKRRAAAPAAQPVPDTTPPTDPGSPSAAVSGGHINVTASASSDADSGVGGYELSRMVGSGSWAVIQAVLASPSYADSDVSSGLKYTYRWRAFDNAFPRNYSGYATTSQVTMTGGDAPDTDKPATPGSITLNSGGADVLAYSQTVATVADATVGGHVRSGMGTYEHYADSVLRQTKPEPALGSWADYFIHPSQLPAPTGSDDGSTIAVLGDGDVYNGAHDFYLRAKEATGDLDWFDITVTGLTGDPTYGFYKSGLMFRLGSSPTAACIYILIADNTGYGMRLNVEWKDADGGPAGQTQNIAAALPIRIRGKRRANTFTLQYATNPSSPSWVTQCTRVIDSPDTILVGRFANKSTMVYTVNADPTLAGTVTFESTEPTDGTSKTVVYKVGARDLAGNLSTLSSGLSVTYGVTGGGVSAAFRAGASATSTAGGGGITVNKPTGTAEDDILLLIVGVDANDDSATMTWPSGFTEIIARAEATAGEGKFWVAWKKAGSSEPSTYTATCSVTGAHRAAIIAAVSGCNTTTPIDTSGSNTNSASSSSPKSITANAVTASMNGTLVFFAGNDFGSSQSSASWAPPSGMTEIADLFTGTWLTLTAAYKDGVSAGSTGSITGTATRGSAVTDDGPVAGLIVLKSGGVGGGGGGGGGSGDYEYPLTACWVGGFDQRLPTAERDAITNRNIIMIGAKGSQLFNSPYGTRQQMVADLKARQAAKSVWSRVINYTNHSDLAKQQGAADDDNWRQDVIDRNWFTYQVGTSGDKSDSHFDPVNFWAPNITRYAPPVPGGLHGAGNYPGQQSGQRNYDYFIGGLHGAHNVATNLDGISYDVLNVAYEPMVYPYDITRTNLYPGWALADKEELYLAWGQGHADMVGTTASLTGMGAGGNISDWHVLVDAHGVGALGAIYGLAKDNFCEFMFGSADAAGTGPLLLNTMGTDDWLTSMELVAGALHADNLTHYMHFRLNADGTDPILYARAGQAIRWAMTACLLIKGGVYKPTGPDESWEDRKIYDYEYFKGGTLNTGRWLGKRVARTRLSNGIYLMEFEKGFAIHVPAGKSGTVPVASLGGSGAMRRLTTTLSSSIDTGATVTADFSLTGPEGLFLRRVSVYG